MNKLNNLLIIMAFVMFPACTAMNGNERPVGPVNKPRLTALKQKVKVLKKGGDLAAALSRLHLEQAIALAGNKSFEEAAKELAMSLSLKPGNRDSIEFLIKCLKTYSKSKPAPENNIHLLEKSQKGDDKLPFRRSDNHHLKKTMKAKALNHYKKGVKYYVNEDLRRAIVEWQRALAIDPGLVRAKEDLKNAKALLEKLKKFK